MKPAPIVLGLAVLAAWIGYRWFRNQPNNAMADSQPSEFTLSGIPQTRAGVVNA